MTAREEIQSLLDTLSGYECAHLLAAIENVAAGERFWEAGVSTLYNEYAKFRSYGQHGEAESIPAGPSGDGGVFAPIPIVKPYHGVERVVLPPPEMIEGSIGDLLPGRRSRREYIRQPISLRKLSTLLYHTCGITGWTRGYGYARLPLRSFPSCGGLQVPEVYLSIQAVDDAPPGIYHYHVLDNALDCLRPGDHGPLLRDVALGQSYVERAVVVFLITGYLARLRWKYGERAYRYMCMDVGFLAQNLYLAGEALGLGVCAIAGFADDGVEQLLRIDGEDEISLLLASVGVLS